MLLQIDALQKSFGKLAAIKSVSFDVAAGQVHGLIGPNGSGKTTLFNLVSGFLSPTAGQVRFRERVITGLKAHAIARLGLVRTFQLTSVYPEMSVAENVRMGLHRRPAGSSVSSSARVQELLDMMDLTSYHDTKAALLPAGSQRLLSIATALATSPHMLLLDEPLAGLNPTEKAETVKKIRSVRDGGTTILLVEHDIKSVLSICDRITAINFGEKIAEGTPDDIVKDERLIEAYLGNWGKADA
ncbi:amino acid/amide ABC transporter ATP-binding protein 1, HAAT family [Arboricoccus pini]|uniref:Amino acid/amide ABC transporter ATP-binding protein 1, HAAT family n=1 Tax=Arboricoccus pini TaxID=1963835 RepID=A0A212Q009_9PROT|nr:ABC transporter ATP-binding protein [Arboricoccus pini]SNB52652.1 amino acid/amide ABC transporter ATP-binding protein 1, HAAT family [Arboricoccus pini]